MNQSQAQQPPSPLVEYVRQGHALGWSFTPLNGKRPVLHGWQSAERETLEQALEWAAAGNVGLRTGLSSNGSSGVLVIDLDTVKPDYDAALVKAMALPLTITAQTGSGGWHLYFAMPATSPASAPYSPPPASGADHEKPLGNSSGKLAPAVDTRGQGGQVVFPGSIHPETGKPYRWMPGRGPGEIALAELPAHVLAVLRGESTPPHAAGPSPAATTPSAANTTGRDANKYGRKALADEMIRVSAAVPGERNATLNASAFSLGQLVGGGVLTFDAVLNGLQGAVAAAGWDTDDHWRARTEATIRSGIESGRKEPRYAPEPTYKPRRAAAGHDSAGTGTPPACGTPEEAHGAAITESAEDATGDDGLVRLGSIDPDSRRLVLSAKRTLPTAAAFVRQFHLRRDGRTLHSYGGRLLAWEKNRYSELEDGAIKHALQPWLHASSQYVYNMKSGEFRLVPFDSNPATVNSALETIRAHVHIDQSREVPFWLSGATAEDGTPLDKKPDPREILPCLTCNLHIPTGTRTPATPDLFTFNAIDFDYDEFAPVPEAWLTFLRQLWPDDPQAIGLLQEWFGYCLTADTAQQKMLLIQGPKRCGKGTIARILTELVGQGNVAGPTVESLAETFGLQQLIGKSVAIVSDARWTCNSLSTVIERLLCISGEDTMTIGRKFQDYLTVKLGTRLMFLSNDLPNFRDASAALVGRFMILHLQESFFGKEDTTLLGRLRAELPGILLWAILGWISLHKRGKFLMPESSKEIESMLVDISSPIMEFVRQCCETEEGGRVDLDDLYAVYRTWCEGKGQKHIPSRQGLGRDLASALPGVKCRRNHASGRFYDGLALKAEYVTQATLGGGL